MEWQTYNYWFDTFKEKTKVNTIIYVNTEPQLCYQRIKKRNRNGESDIPIEYLNHCHQLHEEWLCDKSLDTNIITFNGNQDIAEIDENTYINSLDYINSLV